MFNIQRSICSINTNTILNNIYRQFHQCSKVYMNDCVYEESTQIYNYNKEVDMINSYNSVTFTRANPFNYKNDYFWLKILESKYFAFGIKNKFISEYGSIDYINIEFTPMKRLSYNQYFGDIENNKTIYALEAPFDNCLIVDKNEDISLDMLNNDPENIKHHLCILEHVLEHVLE